MRKPKDQLLTSSLSQKSPSNNTFERVTTRAILFSILLAIINDYWLVQLEVVRYSFATYAAPFYNVIFTLLVVTGLNFLVRKHAPRWAFTKIELLTIYVMLSVTSAVCSHNMMEILVSCMGYAFFFHRNQSGWDSLFLNKLPKWLTVHDQTSLRNFYYGESSLYQPENYLPWLVPIMWWSLFCAVLLFTMLCINCILRKQWIENERLTFPIVILPLEMTEESGALYRNRFFWLGFGIAGSLILLTGLNFLFPEIPCIPLGRWKVLKLITQPPWSAFSNTVVSLYFWAIGIAFLMPMELSASCWIFHLVTKLEKMVCLMIGSQLYAPGGGFDNTYPFLSSQSYGAYLGFFALSMWSSRNYLGRVFRTAFKGSNEEDESREPISYKVAILGAIFGGLLLALFARCIGMSGWVIATFFVLYFIFAVIASRIRAELGFPIHDMHHMAPQYPLMTAFGSEKLGANNFIGFATLFWFNRTYASHPAPHQLESFKISERSNVHARQFFVAALIAGIVAMPIGFWMLLHNYYHLGGATSRMEEWTRGFGNGCYTDLYNRLSTPFPSNLPSMIFVGVGFLVSTFLGWMRIHFLWFPLHPLAYAISDSWGVNQLWVPLFIGGTAKFCVLKYGGLPTYRRALPFFFGLIVGEIALGSLWTIIGISLGISTYDFWPGHYNR